MSTAGNGYIIVPGFQSIFMLKQLYVVDIDLLLAITAFESALLAVRHVEVCCHWLVVRYTVEVVALDDVMQLIGEFQLTFLYHLVVTYGVDDNIGGYYGDLAQVVFCEEAVGNLDESFLPIFLLSRL